eukprot:521299-Prorocentrum_minimum.AAC.1
MAGIPLKGRARDARGRPTVSLPAVTMAHASQPPPLRGGLKGAVKRGRKHVLQELRPRIQGCERCIQGCERCIQGCE